MICPTPCGHAPKVGSDYTVTTDEAHIVAAFSGIDVVISTIGFRAVVPSDYGVSTDDTASGPFIVKKFAEFSKGIDLPCGRGITGLWPDCCLTSPS